MHLDEMTIDKELVKRLIKNQFPQWADLSVEPINATGTDNVIYRLGKEMAIRLPRIPRSAPNINKEYEWLPKLATHIALSYTSSSR